MTSGPPSASDGINATVLGTLSASLLFSVVSVHVNKCTGTRCVPQARACCEVDAKEFKVIPCAVIGELVSALLDNDPTLLLSVYTHCFYWFELVDVADADIGQRRAATLIIGCSPSPSA